MSPGGGGDRLAVCGFGVLATFESSKGVEKGSAPCVWGGGTDVLLSAKGSTAMDEWRAASGCLSCRKGVGVKSRAVEGVRSCLRSWRGMSGVRNGLRIDDGAGGGAKAEEPAKLWWSGTGIIVVLIEGKAGALERADRLLECALPVEAENIGIRVSPDRNDL